MARVYYDGRTITELREWARELEIKGRSKMNGHELSDACKAVNLKNLIAKEDALIEKVGGIADGTELQYANGLRFRVIGDVETNEFGTRFVRGEYTSVGDGREYHSVHYANDSQYQSVPGGHRHMLAVLQPVPPTPPKNVLMMCCDTRYATLTDTFGHTCTGAGSFVRIDLRTGNVDYPCQITREMDCVDDHCPLHRRDIDGQKESAEMLIQDPRGSGMGYNLGGGYVLGEIDRTGV